jgi:hypothetical protein
MDENIQELKESMLRLTDVLGNQAQLLENQTRIMMAGMKQEDIEKLKEAYIDLKEENMYLSKENLRLEEQNEVLKKSNLELSKKLETKENK